MKILLSVLLAVSTFAAPSVSVAGINLAAVACGPDAPAAWLRPGGYCDQIGSNGSLVPPDAGDGEGDMIICKTVMFEGPLPGVRVDVAGVDCWDPCIGYRNVLWENPVLSDRVRIAGEVCSYE